MLGFVQDLKRNGIGLAAQANAFDELKAILKRCFNRLKQWRGIATRYDRPPKRRAELDTSMLDGQTSTRSLWWRRLSWSKTHPPEASSACQVNGLVQRPG
ncbi:hypothetical protein ACIQWB_27710 [Streptomyces olivaceus]|uniref:hypothetical protein n=1 Tax=Streptomyces olivaceus TaxID=47716 RepID=UPI00381B4E24